MEREKHEIWLKCPYCVRKTKTKVLEKTVLLHYPLFCPWCKKEYIISFVNGKAVLEKETGV